MIYLNENGGRQEIWIPLKGKANGYNGTTAPLYEEITENGEYVWDRSNGFSPVTVKVDVKGGGKVDVGALGIKLQFGTFTEVPDYFDFSNCTNMYFMFNRCSSLTTAPVMDTGKVTTMEHMFQSCLNLVSFPMTDTSKVINMQGMFDGCTNLTSIPAMDTSNVTNMSEMFYGCKTLISIPQLDTSNVTEMNNMFVRCESLTTIPQLDTSSVTYMDSMFMDCTSLTTIPQMDTGKVRVMQRMFMDCSNLTEILGLNISSMDSVGSMLLVFWGCTSLTSLTLAGSINTDLELKDSPLNEDSIKSVLTAASKTTNTTAKTLTFKEGSTLKDSDGVWAALISECTSKGWTIQNLTLA